MNHKNLGVRRKYLEMNHKYLGMIQKPKNKSLLARNESQVLRNESQKLRSEAQVLKNEPLLVRNELHELRNEAQVIRNKSQVLRNEAQVIRNESQVHRNTLFKLDEKICMPLIKSNKTYHDLDDVLDIPLFEGIETDNDLYITFFDDIEKDNELFELYEESNYVDIEEKEDNKERTIYLDKINNLIDQANLLAETRNDFSKNVDDVCMLMNELQDEIYSDDSWLRLAELNKINVLLDDSLNYVWKTIHGENREKHEKINIDKNKDIDGYVSKYTDIVNDKLELVNRTGELLDGVINDIQNEADMIDNMKQVREIDTGRLKSIHNTLATILKRWRDIILEIINRDSKPDTKKKDKPDTKKNDKPDTEPDTKKKDKYDTKKKDKPDTKPDTKKKDKPDSKPDTKPETKKKDKPDTNKKDTKPDTKKKDTKPDTKKKDTKLDTNKDTNKKDTKLDIEKHREILKNMISEGIRMLLTISAHLLNSIKYTSCIDNYDSFYELCDKKTCKDC